MDKNLSTYELSQLVGAELGMPHKILTEFYVRGDELFRTDNCPSQKDIDAHVKVLKEGYHGVSSKFIANVYPDFAADMSTAWLLVEAMRAADFDYQIDNNTDRYKTDASFWKESQMNIDNPFINKPIPTKTHTHAPTAIVLSAAKALGVKSD